MCERSSEAETVFKFLGLILFFTLLFVIVGGVISREGAKDKKELIISCLAQNNSPQSCYSILENKP